MTPSHRLETRALSVGYRARSQPKLVASGLNLCLRAGELTCLIGTNGIGKSTLLRSIAGLQKSLSGEILVDGVSIARMSADELARRISVVLTDQPNPGELRVHQVVALGRLPYTNWLGTLSEQDQRLVVKALTQVNALHLAERSFGELSDGERQKVMVARALAQEPAVMILDEPTAFLDWPNRVDLLVTLKNIARDAGKAILISSHDLELVLQIADELWVMGRQGGIVCGACQELTASGVLDQAFTPPHAPSFPIRPGCYSLPRPASLPSKR